MFHSEFERENDKALKFNIVHFSNFEITLLVVLSSLV